MVANDTKLADRVQAAEAQCRYLDDVAKTLQQRITMLGPDGSKEDCPGGMQRMRQHFENIADSLTLRLSAMETPTSECVPRSKSHFVEEERSQPVEAQKHASAREDELCSNGAVDGLQRGTSDRETSALLQGMAQSLAERIKSLRIDSTNVTIPPEDVLEGWENEVRVLQSSVDKLENRLDILEKTPADKKSLRPVRENEATLFEKDVKSLMMAQRADADKIKMDLERYIQTVPLKQSSVDTATRPENDDWVPKANYEALQKECDKLSKQWTDAIQSLEHSQKEQSDSQMKCSNALAALEDARVQASESPREVERLMSCSHQQTEQPQSNLELKTSIQYLETDLAMARQELQAKALQLEHAQVEVEDAQTKNLSLVQEMEARYDELNKMQREKQDDQKMQGILLQKVEKVEKEKQALQQRLDSLDDLARQEIINKEILLEDNNRLKLHPDEIEERLSKLQAENLALNYRLSSLPVEDAVAELEMSHQNYNVLQLKYATLEIENDELKNQLAKGSFSEGLPTSASVPLERAANLTPRSTLRAADALQSKGIITDKVFGRARFVPANGNSPSPIQSNRTVFEQTPYSTKGVVDRPMYYTTKRFNGSLAAPLSGSIGHVPFGVVRQASSSAGPKGASTVVAAGVLSENREIFRTTSTIASPNVVGRFVQFGTPVTSC